MPKIVTWEEKMEGWAKAYFTALNGFHLSVVPDGESARKVNGYCAQIADQFLEELERRAKIIKGDEEP